MDKVIQGLVANLPNKIKCPSCKEILRGEDSVLLEGSICASCEARFKELKAHFAKREAGKKLEKKVAEMDRRRKVGRKAKAMCFGKGDKNRQKAFQIGRVQSTYLGEAGYVKIANHPEKGWATFPNSGPKDSSLELGRFINGRWDKSLPYSCHEYAGTAYYGNTHLQYTETGHEWAPAQPLPAWDFTLRSKKSGDVFHVTRSGHNGGQLEREVLGEAAENGDPVVLVDAVQNTASLWTEDVLSKADMFDRQRHYDVGREDDDQLSTRRELAEAQLEGLTYNHIAFDPRCDSFKITGEWGVDGTFHVDTQFEDWADREEVDEALDEYADERASAELLGDWEKGEIA